MFRYICKTLFNRLNSFFDTELWYMLWIFWKGFPEIIAGSCEPQESPCLLSREPLRGLFWGTVCREGSDLLTHSSSFPGSGWCRLGLSSKLAGVTDAAGLKQLPFAERNGKLLVELPREPSHPWDEGGDGELTTAAWGTACWAPGRGALLWRGFSLLWGRRSPTLFQNRAGPHYAQRVHVSISWLGDQELHTHRSNPRMT